MDEELVLKTSGCKNFGGSIPPSSLMRCSTIGSASVFGAGCSGFESLRLNMDDFVKSNNLSFEQLAQMFSCSKSTAERCTSGKSRPADGYRTIILRDIEKYQCK